VHVRAHLALLAVPPDHPARWDREAVLGRTRRGLDPAWLGVIEPRPFAGDYCSCFQTDGELALHTEIQDTESDAWKYTVDAIEDAAASRATELDLRFAPLVTLPRSIGKLTELRSLNLYHSQLARLPRELGACAQLETITPYTSYNLHWFPFELSRCEMLEESTVSTRALYGNYKFRPPFPRLVPFADELPARPCSVCAREFADRGEHRVWITLRIATDTVPTLVDACSLACLARLPSPPAHYVDHAHRGGLDVVQPKAN
jgi:hypothetical protein